MSEVVLDSGARKPRRRRSVVVLGALVAMVIACLTLGAASARAVAGQWAQATCQNPDGSSSNGDGWAASGAQQQGSSQTPPANCNATTPMTATLVGSYSAITILNYAFTPPPGSVLVGASVNGAFSAWGQGGLAVVYSPVEASDAADEKVNCANAGGCTSVTGGTGGAIGPASTTTWTIPSPATGGGITVQAACAASACANGTGGTVAQAQINWADELMQTSATPAASGISGSAVGSAPLSGTAALLFTATESNGPGVENVTVSIDGNPVYSATPNTNDGACATSGSYAGAPLYDSSQPCPTSTAVDASVPTTAFPDGTHTLTATVTDAAGDTSTVVDQPITIDNAAAAPPAPTTPAPTTPTTNPLRKIHDKALFSWDYRRPVTRLQGVKLARHARLPAAVRISVQCEPAQLCPKQLPARPVGIKQLPRLFRALRGTRFKPGAVFQLTIAARHRRAERFVWTIRRQRSPIGHLRSGFRVLPKHPGPATTHTTSTHKRRKGAK